MIGEFQLAQLVAIGAGEAPPDVAEQLRFEQRLGQSCAVDGDEMPSPSGNSLCEWPGRRAPCPIRFPL